MKTIILFLILLLYSCSYQLHDNYEIDDEEIKNILQSETLPLKRKWDYLDYWMHKNIAYIQDKDNQKILEYWQSPYETYMGKKGDCEDKAILFSYFMYKYTGINCILYSETVYTSSFHMFVRYNTYMYNYIENEKNQWKTTDFLSFWLKNF